eukprot:SAG11_NODE_8_length_31217_cov_52.169677_6_plen_363_part_00
MIDASVRECHWRVSADHWLTCYRIQCALLMERRSPTAHLVATGRGPVPVSGAGGSAAGPVATGRGRVPVFGAGGSAAGPVATSGGPVPVSGAGIVVGIVGVGFRTSRRTLLDTGFAAKPVATGGGPVPVSGAGGSAAGPVATGRGRVPVSGAGGSVAGPVATGGGSVPDSGAGGFAAEPVAACSASGISCRPGGYSLPSKYVTQPTTSWSVAATAAETSTYFARVAGTVTTGLVCFTRSPVPKVCTTGESCCMSCRIVRGPAAFHIEHGPSASSESEPDDPDSNMTRRRLLMGTTAAARRHRADPHVVRAAAPHCSCLVPQSLVPQLGSTAWFHSSGPAKLRERPWYENSIYLVPGGTHSVQ